MPRRLSRPGLITAMMLALLGGCRDSSDRPLNVVVIGSPGSPYATGARLSYPAQLLRSATVEGLVGFDEQGRVVPALADRWIVTDDGQSYIFRLRDGTWPDGSPITGDSARQALQQAIDGVAGTPLAQDLGVVEDVRTMAGRVIEVRLSRPFPDLLQLLAQPELGLTRRGRGSGPMKAVRSGGVAVLSAIPPADRGLPDQEDWASLVRKIRFAALPAASAMERFDQGEADVVLGGRIEDFPRIDLGGFSRGAIRLDPVAGLFGLIVVHGDGFLSRPENREAIAMTIDRDALMAPFNLGGWSATTRIVNPGLPGDTGQIGERWPGQSLAERRAAASARVARWAGAHRDPVVLRIAMPAGPGSNLLFRQVAADLKAIGLGARLVGENEAADLRLLDVVARYPRSIWFMNQLSCASVAALCNSQADRLAAAALAQGDPAKQADQQAQAEAELTKTNSFIPFGVPVRWSLLSGNASGFSPNGWNAHPLMAMATLPK